MSVEVKNSEKVFEKSLTYFYVYNLPTFLQEESPKKLFLK